MRHLLLAAFVAVVLSFDIAHGSLIAKPPPPTTIGTTETVGLGNGIPPRFMWGWGPGLSGYCGEFSFQSIGLYLGNYISAEHMRNAAGGELLIAVNDEKAAKTMKYTYEEWNYAKEKTPQGSNFLDWAATQIDRGNGVIAGFYEQITSGDEDYDHIMPIIAYKRTASSPAVRLGAQKGKSILPQPPIVGARNDVLGVYYNDLYRNSSMYGEKSSNFIKSRSGCRPAGKTPKSPPFEFCIPTQYAYGIALTGVQDTKGELYASQLSVSSWTEPDWGKEDRLHEPIIQLTASIFISGLTPGKKYSILRFDSPSDVPTSSFSRGSFAKRFDFTASGYSHDMPNFDSFRSDSTVFYRTIDAF